MNLFDATPEQLGVTRSLQFNLTPKYIAHSAKSQGFSLENAIVELIDNSIDAKSKNVYVSMDKQPNGLYTWRIDDDGVGMSNSKLARCITEIGYDGTYNADSISAYGTGMKFGLFSICDEGDVLITTINNRIKSTATFSTRMKDAGSVKLDKGFQTVAKNGTSITVTNVDFNERSLEAFIKNLSVIYWFKRSKDSNFKLFVPNPNPLTVEDTPHVEVKFQDPFYRHLDDENNTYFKRVHEVVKIDGHDVHIYGYSYNNALFTPEMFVNWDTARRYDGRSKDGFINRRSGIFVVTGNRYSVLGNGDFFFGTFQNSCNNLRIEVVPPKEVTSKFTQINKSKTQLKQSGMEAFRNAVTAIINDHVRERYRNSVSIEIDENEDLTVDSANNLLKNKLHKNPLDSADLRELIIDEPVKERKPHQGGTKFQPSFKKNPDLFNIRYANLGARGVYMEGTKREKCLVLTLNLDHPYITNYINTLNPESKAHAYIKMYTQFISLIEVQARERFSNHAFHKFMEIESDFLLKQYESED